jgi:hypothetical protein
MSFFKVGALGPKKRGGGSGLLQFSKIFNELLSIVFDDEVVVVHHDAEGLADDEGHPDEKVAPSLAPLVLHLDRKVHQRNLVKLILCLVCLLERFVRRLSCLSFLTFLFAISLALFISLLHTVALLLSS